MQLISVALSALISRE